MRTYYIAQGTQRSVVTQRRKKSKEGIYVFVAV